MKKIRTRLLSLLLVLVTVLSLLPTSALAASSTGTGIKPTSNTNYWTTRLLHDGTPYSYKPPMAAGKMLYCMDRGYGYRWGTPSFLNSYTYNRAQASRRQASRSQRRFFAAREDLHAVGSRITCRMLAVGPRRCLVDCYGYDLDMTQREIRYAAIPDLRTEFHPGSEIDCIVKEYHPRTGELIVSAKETEVNPFFGAEERHPVGSRRFAMISGKYGGGVFCNLPDGVTCMCNYSYQHEDADFMVGEHVMLMVQRYDQEKLQMYGKIMSKW